MALQSQLFRGDPKLEAAALSDPAHIALGAKGPHVGKIQSALNQLDGVAIAQDLAFGPSTAAAVRAFKEKRRIVNLQGRIDDIVGKKTIAALDGEMLAQQPGPNSCVIPSKLRFERSSVVGSTVGGGNEADDRRKMTVAFQESRQTTRQAALALHRLAFQIDLQRPTRRSRPAILNAENERTFIIADRWLHLSSDPFEAGSFILQAASLMDRSLLVRTSQGAEVPLARDLGTFIASTNVGLDDVPLPDGGIRFGTPFFAQHGPLCRRHAVTHEMFHFVGAHHGGQPSNVKTDLSAVRTPGQALNSAENLAELVAELTAPDGKTQSCDRDGE